VSGTFIDIVKYVSFRQTHETVSGIFIEPLNNCFLPSKRRFSHCRRNRTAAATWAAEISAALAESFA
jgi:hypothetical protein